MSGEDGGAGEDGRAGEDEGTDEVDADEDRGNDDRGNAASGDPLDDRLDDVASEAEGADDPDADPFETIGEGTGPRHGDPFDPFADAARDDGDREERADPARGGLPSGIAGEDDDFREGAGDVTDDASGDAADGTAADRDTGDPFTEFDEPTTDPFGEGETVFDDAATGEFDGDGVWERVDSTDAQAEEVPGKRYVDVNKHSYCETCEHFSEPPEVSCSHEGTEILEFVDMETVRVVDCPIVEERNVLEETE